MTAPRRIRLTGPTVAVLDVLMSSTVDDPVWGLRICEETDLGTGTVYPIVERLAELGWLESWREVEQPSGRPRRRYYRLTNIGRAGYADALAARNARRRRWAGLLPARRAPVPSEPPQQPSTPLRPPSPPLRPTA